MNNRTKRGAEAARSTTAQQHASEPPTIVIRKAPQNNRPPPVPRCEEADCPVHNWHPAKEYKADAKDIPKVVLDKEARLTDSMPFGKRIYETKWLNRWYKIHDKSRPLLEEPAPRPRKCTNPKCPIKSWHVDKVYEEDADDLPRIIKEKAARLKELWAQGKSYEDTFDTKLHKFLDQFFAPAVHGGPWNESAGGSSAEGE